MQAATLLAVIAPATQAKGGPAGLFAPAEGEVAEAQGQGAEAVNPFAQALAALMAAPGQAQAQNPPAPGPKNDEAETAPQGAAARSQGLQTALAAVSANDATAKGLIELTTPSVDGAAAPEAPDAGAAPTATVAAPATETGAPIPVLPDTAKADEALATRLAAPSPRAEPAQTVAKGPHLPAWAAPAPPPTPDAAPPAAIEPTITAAIPAEPIVQSAATPVETPATLAPSMPALPAGEPVAALAQAASAPATSQPQAADGKALGKTEAKGGKSALAPGQTASTHGRGLATAPGQMKKTPADDLSAEPHGPEAEVEAATSQAPDHNTDAPGALVADQARAMPAPAHGEGNRLAAHTIAHLASQIVSKADGKATRFDVQLDPAGLGKVDVKIEISRGGEISAALSFDNPQAAAEMRSRAGELRQALEQAGFDLSKGGLSFDLNSQNPGRQPFDQQPGAARPTWAHGAFTDLAALPEAAPPALRRLIAAGGVDVTI